MARVKAPPRVAQPDLERQAYTSKPQAMSSAINEYQIKSSQASDDENNHDTNKPILPKTAIVTGSEQPMTEKRSAAEELVSIGHRLALTNLACPQCLSRFPDMGIKEFREHIESCTRPVTGDSESTTSSLSSPPESHHGDESAEGAHEADGGDESTDLDHLAPYVAGEFTSYPESKGDAAGNGDMETADAQSRTHFGKLTDSQLFIDSLDDAEDLPYDVLFKRVKNASRALVQWQNEWMDLDRFIEVTEPVGGTNPAKPHKNPRIPKDTQIGIGYRDELESFVYGFEYQYHQSKVGKQNPERQRYTNGANRGRELRQRIPTQKAVEADLSTSPDSDEGIGTRRRGRAQKLREGTADGDSAGGRGQRGRNGSRIDSQSRDQTPASTFPSGKKRGRPAKAKVAGASRLQEIQLQEGFEYDSTPEPSHDQRMPNYTENPGSMTRRRSYGFHETLETTERWHDDTEQDEPASRPGTSDSTMTGPSDDMRNPPARSSGRGRKRQNTSDFEDALPSHKRIRKVNSATANGFNDLDLAQSAKDTSNAEKTRNTRRGRQEEDGLPGAPEDILADSTSRLHDSASKTDTIIQRNQSGKERKMVTLKTSNGISRTPANAVLARSTITEPLLSMSAQQDGKDGPKISRASLNMRRRWAAKKQAEALGLPVPKIGRYPKGGSAPSTPDVGDPDLLNSHKSLAGRKRKRDEEPSTASAGVADAVAVTTEAPILVKKRGGRPRKAVNVEPPKQDSAGQHMIRDGSRSNTSPSDKEDTNHEASVLEVVPKRKGGRPRKKPVEIDKGTMVTEGLVRGTQEGTKQIQHISPDPNDYHSKVDETRAVVHTENFRSANEEDISSAANVEETETPQQLRRTTRVRRQTSAALSASSQANTRRSSGSSQKSTVTPTPSPTQQPAEETVIKQETLAGPTLPKKRGRRPKSAVVGTAPDAAIIAANMTEDEAPPAKRRRVGRPAKLVSPASTPTRATVSEDEHSSPQEDLANVQKQGPRKRRASVLDTLALEALSDGQASLAELSLQRKWARKPPITDTPATDAPSATPGSSVEPSVTKKRGGRPRKNVDVVTASGLVTDVSVKAEDAPRLPEPLTTRARSSGQDNATRVNPSEDLTVGRQAIDSELPKKKGNWGGKRVKGVFSSGNAPKPIVASGSYGNTGADDIEEQAQFNKLSALETSTQQAPRKGSLSGLRNRRASGEMDADAAEFAAPSDSPSRPKRVVSKTAAPIDEAGIQDAVAEMLSNAPSRPKRAVTMTEAFARETNLDNEVAGPSSSALPRPRRVINTAVPLGGGMSTDDTGTPSNIPSRSKRAVSVAVSPEEDAGETGIDDGPSNASSRPKRVATVKISPAGTLAADNADPLSDAIVPTENFGTDVNKGAEKKNTWGGRRIKGTGAKAVALIVNGDNEDSDSEATRKEKKYLAAKASKSFKNSQSMKARWANGSMHEIMRRKREANLARKAAAARASKNGEEAEGSVAEPSAPASAPAKRKAAPTKAASRAPKRRRTMNATMDGPADTDDEYDIPEASSSGPTSPIDRRMSEYDRYQQLSSPIRSTHNRRKRRPAALRASQSFSKFTDDGDDVETIDDNDEDVETEIKKQFDSEYEHFRALTPPFRGLAASNILQGKRKRKPVINLEEAMRIEAGDEDDLSTEG